MLRYSEHSAFSEPAYIQAFLVDLAFVPCAFASYARPFLRSRTQISHIQLRDLPLASLSSSNCCAISTGSLCCVSAVLRISSISFLRLLFTFLSACRQLDPCPHLERQLMASPPAFVPFPPYIKHGGCCPVHDQLGNVIGIILTKSCWGQGCCLNSTQPSRWRERD